MFWDVLFQTSLLCERNNQDNIYRVNKIPHDIKYTYMVCEYQWQIMKLPRTLSSGSIITVAGLRYNVGMFSHVCFFVLLMHLSHRVSKKQFDVSLFLA